MKLTTSAAVGGYNFILDNDAYEKLRAYLERFRMEIDPSGAQEVMDELEMRIADLFLQKLKFQEVVSLRIVDEVIAQIGLPKGETFTMDSSDSGSASENSDFLSSFRDFVNPKNHKMYRDPDERKILGVCSGLSLYLDVDVIVIRLVFVISLLLGLAGLWIYLLMAVIVPEASTASQKCELRGLPINADNLAKFAGKSRSNYKK